MKKLIATLAIVAISLLSISTASANRPDKFYSYKASQYLKEQYGQLENVKWTEMKDGMIRADFPYEETTVTVFFEGSGKHVATTTTLDVNHLNFSLRKVVNKHLGQKELVKLIHLQSEKEEAYYIETRQNDEKVIWRMDTDGVITRHK